MVDELKKVTLAETLEKLQSTVPIEKKIEVFEHQIKSLQIGVAKELVEKKINNCGLAVVSLLFSYFENIAKYKEGITSWHQAGDYCKKGLEWVFPDINSWGKDLTESFKKNMYSEGRCSLYHTTIPGYGIMIVDNLKHPIELDKENIGTRKNPIIYIDYTKLHYPIALHFDRYITSLKEPDNKELRNNFEKRFDSIYFKSPDG